MTKRFILLAVLVCSIVGIWAAGTNTVTKDVSAPFFSYASQGLWQLGIAIVTPTIVFLVGKLPQVPRPVLPTITPIIGILIGLALKHLADLHLSWVDMGQAGAAGVAVREIFNQWATKQSLPLELSKTAANPLDTAVAVPAATVTPEQAGAILDASEPKQ